MAENSPRIAVYGVGAVGARLARHLIAHDDVGDVLLLDADPERARALASSLGSRARSHQLAPQDEGLPEADVAVLASPSNSQPQLALQAMRAGQHVVATADGLKAVARLLDLDAEARERNQALIVGAGFSPGLSCVLASHAASRLDQVTEIHIARHGTGGPACARQHHAALRHRGLDWRDHAWARRPPRSGRELTFFPDPLGGLDCYRAALPDALLLAPAFPGVARVTARLAATRRDRFTGGLPMLRPPHKEGRIGGLRVEVRGRQGSAKDAVVLGAIDRPAVAAATVAGLTARWVVQGKIEAGARGLASAVEALPFLQELATQGVRAAVFEGAA